MRILMNAPRASNPATKRTPLKVIINNTASKKSDEFFMKVEEYTKKYHVKHPLARGLEGTVIIDSRTNDLKEHLELEYPRDGFQTRDSDAHAVSTKFSLCHVTHSSALCMMSL